MYARLKCYVAVPSGFLFTTRLRKEGTYAPESSTGQFLREIHLHQAPASVFWGYCCASTVQQCHHIVVHRWEDEPPAAPATAVNLLETSRQNVVKRAQTEYVNTLPIESNQWCFNQWTKTWLQFTPFPPETSFTLRETRYVKQEMAVILLSVPFLRRLMCWSTNTGCRRTWGRNDLLNSPHSAHTR